MSNNQENNTEEITNNMDNLDIDSAFTAEDGSKSKKKNKNKENKNKKNGKDFLEYAKKNEIEVKINYEKSPEKKQEKEEKIEDYKRKPYNKNFNKGENNQKNYNNQNREYPQGNHQGGFNKGGYRKNYQNKNKGFGGNNQKTFNNKFDSMNSYNNNPYMFPNMQFMRPDMMYMGQMPMNPTNFNQGFNQLDREDQHHSIGEKGIKESLEYYLSLDNLNKDLFIRRKIDNNGFVLVEDILKFNNMVKHNATTDTIKEVVQESEVIEENNIEGKSAIRNRNWEDIKKKLISIEELEMRKQKKGNNYNFVTMQNNYFMSMMPYDPMMMGQMQGMGNFMPPSMMGGMPYNNQDNQN